MSLSFIDHWNGPSTSKSGLYPQNKNKVQHTDPSEHSLELEVPSTVVVLVDKRVFSTDSSVPQYNQDEQCVKKQEGRSQVPTYFFESDVQLTLQDDSEKKDHTSSASASQGGEKSGESNEFEESRGHETADDLVEPTPSDVQEQRIDTQIGKFHDYYLFNTSIILLLHICQVIIRTIMIHDTIANKSMNQNHNNRHMLCILMEHALLVSVSLKITELILFL